MNSKLNIKIKEIEECFVNETTRYWFDVNGLTWGISDHKGEKTLIDYEGYPTDNERLYDELTGYLDRLLDRL